MNYLNHTKIINYLIEKNNYTSYLEVGVYNGENYNQIQCKHKECCDTCEVIKKPSCKVDYIMTSDEMFKQLPDDKKFDIIFIDAMHDESYVDRDIMNSLKHLNENGVICCHDSLPTSTSCAAKYSSYAGHGAWCGDVFKSIVKLNETNLNYVTVDNSDFGLTIIKFGVINKDLTQLNTDYNYPDLFNNGKPNDKAKQLLHVITVNEFKNGK